MTRFSEWFVFAGLLLMTTAFIGCGSSGKTAEQVQQDYVNALGCHCNDGGNCMDNGCLDRTGETITVDGITFPAPCFCTCTQWITDPTRGDCVWNSDKYAKRRDEERIKFVPIED
jgi:hypothetical protein